MSKKEVMHPAYRSAKHWGDQSSIDKMAEHYPHEVNKAEILNALSACALRFERQPTKSTLEAWADDFARANVSKHKAREVCEMIPRRFEKFPSLSEIWALFQVKKVEPIYEADPWAKEFKEETERLKANFLSKCGNDESIFNKMVKYFEKEVYPGAGEFIAPLMLEAWKFSGFKDAKAIIETGLKIKMAYDNGYVMKNSPEAYKRSIIEYLAK